MYNEFILYSYLRLEPKGGIKSCLTQSRKVAKKGKAIHVFIDQKQDLKVFLASLRLSAKIFLAF